MKTLSILIFTSLIISGCAVSPKPLTMEELVDKRDARLEQMSVGQEMLGGPVSLYEAMARAVKYNLDHKVEMYEEALRSSESDLANLDMLPKLVVSAGLSARDNYSGSRSSTLLGSNSVGGVSLVPSTSSDKSVVTSDLKLSWDILDFGLSYVRAKQKADAVLIANERKRKVANRIIENVRTVFWRAVSAERLMRKLESLESDLEKALTAADEAYRQKKTPPLDALTYQRELLNIQNETQSMHNEMVVAKRQLAALMNVDPATPFTLKVPAELDQMPTAGFKPKEMVTLALLHRPELKELSYEQRISENEATTALLGLLPNLNFFGGFNYTSNEFIFNNHWTGWGAAASWNIFKVFRYPAQKRSNTAQQELLNQRALAMTMAVITQVHVSASKHEIAKRRLATMSKYKEVNNNILDQITTGYEARRVSYQNFVREKMNSIVAEARYDIARAEMQNSYANIYSSIGVDTYGNINAEEASVKELAQHLQEQWMNLETAVKTQSQ